MIAHMYITVSLYMTLRWPVSTHVRHVTNITSIIITLGLAMSQRYIKKKFYTPSFAYHSSEKTNLVHFHLCLIMWEVMTFVMVLELPEPQRLHSYTCFHLVRWYCIQRPLCIFDWADDVSIYVVNVFASGGILWIATVWPICCSGSTLQNECLCLWGIKFFSLHFSSFDCLTRISKTYTTRFRWTACHAFVGFVQGVYWIVR